MTVRPTIRRNSVGRFWIVAAQIELQVRVVHRDPALAQFPDRIQYRIIHGAEIEIEFVVERATLDFTLVRGAVRLQPERVSQDAVDVVACQRECQAPEREAIRLGVIAYDIVFFSVGSARDEGRDSKRPLIGPGDHDAQVRSERAGDGMIVARVAAIESRP